MAMKIADVFVQLQLDKGKFSANIRSAKRETSGFAASATKSLKRISVGLTVIAAAAAAAAVAIAVKLTRAIIRAGRSAVSAAVKYDKLKRGLVAVTGSVEEANKQLIRLRKVAELPGLSFEAAIRGSINLQAAELSARMAERSLTAFGNAIVTMGGGVPELQRVNLQLTQMAAKSSGFGQEIRVLREIVPQIGPILRKAFDDKPLEEVSISGGELLEVIVKGLEDIPRATGGVANSLDNLQIEFDLLKAAIGETMLGAVGDTADSLAIIVKKIAAIIPEWDKYKDQVTKVFMDLIPIIAKATGVMMKSMMNMVTALAPLVWQPLVFAAETAFNELTTVLAKEVVKIFEIIGMGAGQAMIQKIRENIEKSTTGTREALATAFMEPFDEVFKNVLATIPGEISKIMTEIQNLAEAAAVEFGKIEVAVEGAADTAKSASTEFKKMEGLDFLVSFDKKAAEDTAKFHKEQGAKLLKDSKDRIIASRNKLDAEMKPRQKRELAKFRELQKQKLEAVEDLWKKQEEAARKFASIVTPLFESAFTNLFEGNMKGLWEEFWAEMERIAIRHLAAIATSAAFALVTRLLGQLKGEEVTIGGSIKEGVKQAGKITLGATIGGFLGSIIPGVGTAAGIGVGGSIGSAFAEGGIVNRPTLALVGERGPEAIVPLNRMRGGRGGGIYIASMPISFPNANMENIDETMMEKNMTRMIPYIQRAINRGELQA